jgi:ribosomal protein S12 methylthiotransferase accessory factor YcaO
VQQAWILQEAAGAHDDRFLSCSLNIAWPAAALAGRAASIPHAEATLHALTEVFDELSPRSGAIAAQRKVEDHKFEGWLSYSNVDRAWEAFKQLRDALHARGLGVKQWTRDLIIPRGWR